LANKLGFEGNIEYRHVLSGTGGAQYGVGPAPDRDLLVVFAEAFNRDADPDDFSLEAILAHERGHQLLVRHPRLSAGLVKQLSPVSEEILASLIGSLIAETEDDKRALYCKALYEVLARGVHSARAVRLLHELRRYLEEAL
jgi:hypothetical protein